MATNVLMKLTVHARGEMAAKLLEAAAELGLDPGVIRSQSKGFLVPVEVHQYLFPSQYDEDGQLKPADPAVDFADLSDDELEDLTKP